MHNLVDKPVARFGNRAYNTRMHDFHVLVVATCRHEGFTCKSSTVCR
jgi:hypothetical protein